MNILSIIPPSAWFYPARSTVKYLCMGALALGLTACTNDDDRHSETSTPASPTSTAMTTSVKDYPLEGSAQGGHASTITYPSYHRTENERALLQSAAHPADGPRVSSPYNMALDEDQSPAVLNTAANNGPLASTVTSQRPVGDIHTAAYTPGAASDLDTVNSDNREIRFHNFTVTTLPGQEEHSKNISLRYEQTELPLSAQAFASIDPQPEQKDFPLPGCSTMKVDLFTGGANCCSGYYLLTTCENNNGAAYIEPFAGTMSESPVMVSANVRGYLIDDPSFLYYEPADQGAGQPEQEHLALSRVDSPSLQRFVIFDNGVWRVDRQGEYKTAYDNLATEVMNNPEMSPTAKAISYAYYSLMAGKDSKMVEETLHKELPDEYASQAPHILSDLKNAISQFKPVQKLSLN